MVISSLKKDKAAGPDNLVPILFKEGGCHLVMEITKLLGLIWETETVPISWGESIVIPLFKKGSRVLCENHRGISLTPVITRIVASIILNRLKQARDSTTREEQAGFRPGRGCIDQIFTLRQLLEQRHTYRRPTIAVFLDFKGAFDSVDRKALFQTLCRRGLPDKYVNILKSLYSHTTGSVRAYGRCSKTFDTKSGVRQGCPLSPFLFNFIIDEIMEDCVTRSPSSGIELGSFEDLVDLDYADDIVMLFDSSEKAQHMLNTVSGSILPFGMRFAPAKCKVLLQNCDDYTDLSLSGEVLEVVSSFTYLGSCISNDGGVDSEIHARIGKARAAFSKLRHLWREKGVSERLKGRVYEAAVRTVLLYGCETWPVRTEDLKRLQAFDHRCLRYIAGIHWAHKVNNEEVRTRVLGNGVKSLAYAMRRHKLRWLGHVLRMPDHRLPKRVLLAQPASGWRKARGGQKMTWQRDMKKMTEGLGRVGVNRLPGWGAKDTSLNWFCTLSDMASNRNQWRECCRVLAESF